MTFMKTLLLTLSIIITEETINKGPYCYLPCGTKKNIVCKRATCYLDVAKCGGRAQVHALSYKEMQSIVDVHNRIRNDFAGGKLDANGIEVADMMVLSYDKELEFTALCTSNRCKTSKDCARTPSHPTVGQNIYMHTGVRYPPEFTFYEIHQAVSSWFLERQNMKDIRILDSYFKPHDDDVEYFTQLVWAKTAYIGCGSTTYDNKLIIICNYAPAGNTLNEPVFTKGKSCSQCPFDVTCNNEYKNLCGKVKHRLDYVPPHKALAGHLTFFNGILIISFFLIIINK